jgi:hypothetical protein
MFYRGTACRSPINNHSPIHFGVLRYKYKISVKRILKSSSLNQTPSSISIKKRNESTLDCKIIRIGLFIV